MIHALILMLTATSIIGILYFAYMTNSKLASYVAYTILAAIALTMALSGLIGLIIDVEFLAFLVRFFRFLSDIILFIELAVILFLLLMSKHKTKVLLLKVAIIAYVVLTLLVEFNVFN